MSDNASSSGETEKLKDIPRKSRFSTWAQRRFMPVEEISQHARLTSRMFAAITGTETSRRNETFEDAVKRQNLTPHDLLGSYKRQKVITLIMLGMIILALFYVILLITNAASFADYFVAAMALGPITVLAAAGLRASFRAWQIRHKRLGGFDTFISDYKEWWPTKITIMNFENATHGKLQTTKARKNSKQAAAKASRPI